MRLRSLAFLGILSSMLLSSTTNASGLAFKGLKPGEFVNHRHEIPVRVVLIGFEESQVNEDDLRAWLPETYKPLVRYPQFYGLNGREMGLEYRFNYRIIHKNRQFTNRFFDHLASIGTEGEMTFFQQLYNDQDLNVIDIAGPVLYIDGPAVEAYLDDADNHREREYTVYFINWYGRDDFRFHVYTKTDEPDPDTDVNFGLDDSAAMIAWGGTSSRSWFYDFSAGPEWNTVNWLVDFEDLNGNGVADYRMPNIWEYVTGGYRTPDALGGDMGLLVRFVAIDLLFTSSPLYDPLVTAPGTLGAKVAHITMFEDDPASSGAAFTDPGKAKAEWRSLQPYYRWKVGFNDVDPIDPGSKLTLDIFVGLANAPGCWVPFGTPFAQLFCYYDQNLATYVPRYGPRDYVGEVFAFNSTDDVMRRTGGLLGFADDNWIDGTQTYSFVFGADFLRELGYGFTSTIIHEFGHHVGLSHPHDGYDAELGLDFGAGDDLWFAWVGDESDTVMHYLWLSNGFGNHNSDNMYRWEAAGYLNWSNALAGDILSSGKAWKVSLALWIADLAAQDSLNALRDWNYLRSVIRAREAYAILTEAANHIGVTSSSLVAARRALPGAQPVKQVCRPRLLQERIARGY